MLVRKLDFDKVTCCCNSKNCIVKYADIRYVLEP
jgi:hypothetical protein